MLKDSREIIRRLIRDGFVLVSTRGSHHKYRHADGRTVIVTHPRKDIPRYGPLDLCAGRLAKGLSP